MKKSHYKRVFENAAKLNEVSPTFCLAKWVQVSIHLPTGRTHSCYHPPSHKIPLDLLKKDPSVLHNTPLKMLERAQMQKGIRPEGCAYCWKVEDLKGKHLSDRFYHSSEEWAWEKFDEIKSLPWDHKILPRYVEVNFNQACQFKCSYCSPQLSSAWMTEIKQKGFFPTIYGHNRLDWFKNNDLVPYGPTDLNPYVEAFWKWWPQLYTELKVFRMTGGEPLLDENTFKVLDYVNDHPKPDLILSITTNLNPPAKNFERFLNKVHGLLDSGRIKKFALFVSVDATGSKAEYIRNGLNFETLEGNLHKWLAHPLTDVSFIQTCCNLAVPGFKEYLKWIAKLRKSYSKTGQRISFDTPFLRSPEFMSMQILDDKSKKSVTEAAAWARKYNSLQKNEFQKFSQVELAKLNRISEWLQEAVEPHQLARSRADFYFYFTEHDSRRNTNFHKTFPELKKFWELCKSESQQFKPVRDLETEKVKSLG